MDAGLMRTRFECLAVATGQLARLFLANRRGEEGDAPGCKYTLDERLRNVHDDHDAFLGPDRDQVLDEIVFVLISDIDRYTLAIEYFRVTRERANEKVLGIHRERHCYRNAPDNLPWRANRRTVVDVGAHRGLERHDSAPIRGRHHDVRWHIALI